MTEVIGMKKKLVLGSGGIFFENESDPIIDHILSLIEVNKEHLKMVYLPTAGHDDREEDEAFVKDYCMRHGFEEFVSLHLTDESLTDEYIENTIMTASVIYACGGNLKFLLETWRKRKADVYLTKAYNSGIVCAGQSSGAMCWCKRGYDNCGIDGRYMFLDGLNFIPYILCPHFEDWQCFCEDVKMQELDGLAVDNDIAISIVDGEVEIIDSGRNPKHSAFLLPAADGYRVHDIVKEKCTVPNLK